MINPPEPRLRAVVRSKENAPRAGRVACLFSPATAPDGDFDRRRSHTQGWQTQRAFGHAWAKS
jgi:hypothetical protein